MCLGYITHVAAVHTPHSTAYTLPFPMELHTVPLWDLLLSTFGSTDLNIWHWRRNFGYAILMPAFRLGCRCR